MSRKAVSLFLAESFIKTFIMTMLLSFLQERAFMRTICSCVSLSTQRKTGLLSLGVDVGFPRNCSATAKIVPNRCGYDA